ncbi:hypothetical protein, partial [Desulfocicer niacini]
MKKPSNLSSEERYEIERIENQDTGFIKNFRSIIRQIGNIFDHSNTELQAKTKFKGNYSPPGIKKKNKKRLDRFFWG